MTNECAITLFELYAHSCCFYLLKCSLHWRNPYQSMNSTGGGGGGGGGGATSFSLPSTYSDSTSSSHHPLPPSHPSPVPKKFVPFLFLFSAQIKKTRRRGIRNTAFRILPKMRKNLLLLLKFCTEQKLLTNECAITLFAPISVQKCVIAH